MRPLAPGASVLASLGATVGILLSPAPTKARPLEPTQLTIDSPWVDRVGDVEGTLPTPSKVL